MSCTRIVKRLEAIIYRSPVELVDDAGVYLKFKIPRETPILGEGSGTSVVQFKWNGRSVAAKLYGGFDPKESETAEHRKIAAHEIDALKSFNHSHFIVNLLAYCPSPRPCLFFEKMDYSLQSIMDKSATALDKEKCLQILCDISHGIIEVHESGRFHGDIKPANILIKNFRAKLGDFQCSRVEEKFNPDEDLNVTYSYAAPECFTNEFSMTKKIDIYSFGVTFLEVMCYVEFNQDFFWGLSNQIDRKDIRKKTEDGSFHCLLLSGLNELKDCSPEPIPELIKKCMAWDPKERPTAKQALSLLTGRAGLFSSVLKNNTVQKDNEQGGLICRS